MTTFALVHGAWGSGWHWASIPERLRAAGHAVVAPDLPCDDPAATFDDYADAVIDAINDDEDVVLAGFSLGSQTATRVALRRPVRALVHVAGVVPEPGLSILDQVRRGDRLFLPEYMGGLEMLDGGRATRWTNPDVYHRVAYDETVPHELVTERFERLRAQCTTPFADVFDHDSLPPARYVLCTRDRLLDNTYWSSAVEVTDELDSPHQAVVARPDELVQLLLRST